jgi:transcriptional regulator with XRE-family HTH domain
METAGEQLRAWRARRGENMREVAARLRCDPSMLSHLECGSRRPRLVLAVKIQRLTGIPCEAWVSSAQDTTPSVDRLAAGNRNKTKRKAA